MQVNGKLRALDPCAGRRRQGRDRAGGDGDANVQKFVAGQAVKRVIVVPGKLVNVVV